MAKRGLGRGLDALIGSVAATEGQRLDEILVKDVKPNPRQPRQRFDPDSIEQMARSIAAFGVVQPVIVRPVGTEYELIAGERRLRAARKAGLEKIPAIIKESTETDSLEMALIENLHRDDLNGIEEANAYQQLLDDFGITHEELSMRVGKSRATITNTIRLLQLPSGIQKDVMDGKLSTGHARALLALQGRPELQEKLASRVASEGLSVRQTEELVRSIGDDEEPERPRVERVKTPPPAEAVALFKRLEEHLETRVRGAFGKRKGKLVVEFHSIDELRRIYEKITGTDAGLQTAESLKTED